MNDKNKIIEIIDRELTYRLKTHKIPDEYGRIVILQLRNELPDRVSFYDLQQKAKDLQYRADWETQNKKRVVDQTEKDIDKKRTLKNFLDIINMKPAYKQLEYSILDIMEELK